MVKNCYKSSSIRKMNIYPAIIHEGDLSPDYSGSDVDTICNAIHDACKGFGTDEKQLIKAIGATTPDERCLLPLRYKALFGKTLVDVMRSECGKKDFGTAVQFLAVDPVEAECMIIDKACKGAGTDELLLATLICGRTNKEMDILKKKYFALNTKDLGRKLDGELGGALDQLIFNVLQASEEAYDPNFHTAAKMEADVATLHKMGQGKTFGTDEKGLFKILCAAPSEYLEKLNLLYAEKHGFTLVKVLETELSGHVGKAALFMIGMKLKPYEEIAKLIKKSCAGVGTNELLLTSTIIRYQSVMKQVTLAHVELYGETIQDRINSECGGDYKRVLLELLDASDLTVNRRALAEPDCYVASSPALQQQKTPIVAEICQTTPLVVPIQHTAPPKLTTPPFCLLINCGGVEFMESFGRKWMADKYFSGGATFADTSRPVHGTRNDQLYQSHRFGEFQYEIPVPNGSYAVTLHFAEIFWEGVNQRLFQVQVENAKTSEDIDLVQLGGGQRLQALQKTFHVTTSRGYLEITMVDSTPKVDYPLLCGIEIHNEM